MDVNFNIPTLESESSDPFVLSSPGLLSESELLELLWKKGPVEKPLTMQVPPDPPTLQFGEVEPPFITEDEMAMWLHYPIEDGPSGSGVATVGQRIEPVVLMGEPVQKNRHDAPSMCKEQVDSSNVATTKRKWKETAGLQRHDSEGSDLEAGNKSSRRAHKAKVHNLSERRRRERINEKLKALQELIPRCSKSDKVSMLGDAIGYVKSLQKQVQMMSMGNMRPMIFPGAPTPCMTPPIGLGMNMAGLGMNMNMNMNNMGLGMPPFGPVVPCTQFNTQAVQPTMMQMQHQHGTFPPCHFPPFVVPAGQVQMPSHQSSNNQKTEKGKQAESSLL